MNPALIIGGLAAGVALLALTAKPRTGAADGGPNTSSGVRGFPINEAEYHRLRNALKSPEANSEYLMAYFKAPTIQVAIGEGPTEIKRLEAVAREQFRARRTTLPKDAT